MQRIATAQRCLSPAAAADCHVARRITSVHKSNYRGASPPLLNHGLHAIDATPARWRGGLESLSARVSQHGRVLADKGLREEL